MQARRSRVLEADPAAVFAVASAPHHLPRWWPHVQRVEAVTRTHFTEVLVGRNAARPVRADFRIARHEPPTCCVWEQDVEDGPFARVFASIRVTIEVEAVAAGAQVTLTLDQELRGSSKLGAPLARRGTRKLLGQALDGLEDLHRG